MEFITDVMRWIATLFLGLILVFNLVGFAFLGAALIAGADVSIKGGPATVLLGVAAVLACRWAITRLWSVPRARAAA